MTARVQLDIRQWSRMKNLRYASRWQQRIDQAKNVQTTVETLGMWGCSNSSDNDQVKNFYKKGKEWTNCTTNGHLPEKYAWVLYRLKLWMALCYGLTIMATPFKVAEMLLRCLEYKMSLVLGVNRNIKRVHRTTPWVFGGVDLVNLPVEQTISAINMALQHFGVPSILGQKF